MLRYVFWSLLVCINENFEPTDVSVSCKGVQIDRFSNVCALAADRPRCTKLNITSSFKLLEIRASKAGRHAYDVHKLKGEERRRFFSSVMF